MGPERNLVAEMVQNIANFPQQEQQFIFYILH